MRYAYVRRLECSVRGPNGLDRDRFNAKDESDPFGGDSDADSRRSDSYCDSSDCSILLYNFRSSDAALVMYRSHPPTTWRSAVSKLRALETSSISGMGRYCDHDASALQARVWHGVVASTFILGVPTPWWTTVDANSRSSPRNNDSQSPGDVRLRTKCARDDGI